MKNTTKMPRHGDAVEGVLCVECGKDYLEHRLEDKGQPAHYFCWRCDQIQFPRDYVEPLPALALVSLAQEEMEKCVPWDIYILLARAKFSLGKETSDGRET